MILNVSDLLLEPVFHLEPLSRDVLHAALHGVKIGPGLQPELQCCDLTLCVEDTTGKAQGREDVVFVVLGVVDREDHAA